MGQIVRAVLIVDDLIIVFVGSLGDLFKDLVNRQIVFQGIVLVVSAGEGGSEIRTGCCGQLDGSFRMSQAVISAKSVKFSSGNSE